MTSVDAQTVLFVGDIRTETWLKNHEVKFTGPSVINYSDIDLKASLHNQARPVALVDEAVESYRLAIRNGEKLPAIVVYKAAGRWVVVDGNNRIKSGADEGYEKMRAYVIDSNTSSDTINALTASANTINGVATPKSFRLNQAIVMLNSGYRKEVVAAQLHVPVSSIESYQKISAATVRAFKAKVSTVGWENLPSSMKEQLARIKLDVAFEFVAGVVIQYGVVRTTDFKEFITNLNKCASEDAATEFMGKWADEVKRFASDKKRQGRVRSTRNPKLALVSALGKVAAFRSTSLNSNFRTDEEREALTDRLKSSMSKHVELLSKMHTKEEVETMLLDVLTKA